MKKIIYYLLFSQLIIVGNSINAQQNLTISFAGHYYGEAVRLDSILIRNITKGCDTTLYNPDTILVLDYAVGLPNIQLQEEAFTLSQNYPNPVKGGKTNFEVYMPKAGKLRLTATLQNGQTLASFEQELGRGSHLFSYYPPANGVTLLLATDGMLSQHIKILHPANAVAAASKLVYQGTLNKRPSNKTIAASGFEYVWGNTRGMLATARAPTGLLPVMYLKAPPTSTAM